MKNNKGFSIVETMVALAITTTVVAAAGYYIGFLSNIHQTASLKRSTAVAIHSFAENIRFNLSLYQVTFDNSLSNEENMLSFDRLPLAISGNRVIPRSECSSNPCKAYFGYIIIPSEFTRNLYQVKFMVASAHDRGVKWQEDYAYFITVK